MEFDSLTHMWVADKSIEVAPSAQRLLSNRLRVPYSYLSRCPSELQARNLNYWIEQERQQRETFFCRFDEIFSDERGRRDQLSDVITFYEGSR